MAATAAISGPTSRARSDTPAGAKLFFATSAGVVVAACALAGWFPLGASIVAVFLFAGPHNWMEGRYLVSRMPARWGALRAYYLTGIGGVLSLTCAFAALPWVAGNLGWNEADWLVGLATWNTSLVAWILVLIEMRSRQNPRRDWHWARPIGLSLIAAAWLWPQAWDIGLVYLHPLIALWFVDRELRVNHQEWRRPFRKCLALLPLLLGLLWWHLAGAPDLPGNDALSARIAAHAGAGVLAGISTHLLVATHVFLEMLHYGVWLVMIPLVSLRCAPWRLEGVPLARRSPRWRAALAGLLAIGAVISLVLWAGFLSNYPLTRDVYFTVAMLHVLAEAPFLLRLL